MEARSRKVQKNLVRNQRPSFDVTCVVGTVFFDETADRTAQEEAFAIVARQVALTGDAESTFKFPAESGSTCVVNVSFERQENGNQ